ncbi:MAG: glutathione synthase [Legionellales bacterium]|nr:glutathione synthase [Legionellales bacterium]
MIKTLGMVMDPIQSIHPEKDSSLAMLLAAQERGINLFYFTQDDLFIHNNRTFGHAKIIAVKNNPQQWFTIQKTQTLALDELDVVLLRKDPPVNLEYIYLTQLLDLVNYTGGRVINKPSSVLIANEKLFITQFPQCIPETLVTRNREIMEDFIHNQQDIIVKPLDSMGGRGIFRVRQDDVNRNSILETITQQFTRTIMLQRFLPAVSQGDKRILLIQGKPIPYALARIPKAQETRANLAAGGRGEGRELTPRDYFLCEQIGSRLVKLGLDFVGIDVIGDYITEINVTSPTCIRELNHLYQLDIAGQFIESLG